MSVTTTVWHSSFSFTGFEDVDILRAIACINIAYVQLSDGKEWSMSCLLQSSKNPTVAEAQRLKHRCKSSQIFRSAKDFCPNLLEKALGHFLCEYFVMKTHFSDDLQKKSFMYFWAGFLQSKHVGRHFFHRKACGAPFLSVFLGTLHRFLWILRIFSQTLPTFPRILPGVSPNQNFWGCACSPCPPLPTPLV